MSTDWALVSGRVASSSSWPPSTSGPPRTCTSGSLGGLVYDAPTCDAIERTFCSCVEPSGFHVDQIGGGFGSGRVHTVMAAPTPTPASTISAT